jgi:hypothetical protein
MRLRVLLISQQCQPLVEFAAVLAYFGCIFDCWRLIVHFTPAKVAEALAQAGFQGSSGS